MTLAALFQFWENIIKLHAKDMAKMVKKRAGIAEKIALYDCNMWPKISFDNAKVCREHMLAGDEFYSSRDFQKAIDAYNRSICFSSSLECRGIAYANRSAAYYGLSSYRECLDSVLLAKECPLPKIIMNKMLAHEKVAIEGLELKGASNGADDSNTSPAQLSYPSNQRAPSFVFCLKLKEAGNPYGGLITTEDLLPGDVLVVEPTLITFTRAINICSHCLIYCGSLQPCDCTFLMYCSSKCKKEAYETYHKFECPIMEHLLTYSYQDCLVLRIFFKLIQRFQDVRSLREYLENIKAPNPFEGNDFESWPDAGSFESQFRLFYANEKPSMINCTVNKPNLLLGDPNNKNLYTSLAKAAIITDILKTLEQIPRITNKPEEWSFLSEQLFRLFFYKSFNAKAVGYCNNSKYAPNFNIMAINSDMKLALALHGSASLFRSSCRPNVHLSHEENKVIVRASMYIPRGTELLTRT